MGIDSKIYPIEEASSIGLYNHGWEDELGNYEHLYFHRDYLIFEQIKGFAGEKDIKINPIPIKFYKPDFSVTDAYDAPLTWVLASEFSKIILPDDVSPKNLVLV